MLEVGFSAVNINERFYDRRLAHTWSAGYDGEFVFQRSFQSH